MQSIVMMNILFYSVSRPGLVSFFFCVCVCFCRPSLTLRWPVRLWQF